MIFSHVCLCCPYAEDSNEEELDGSEEDSDGEGEDEYDSDDSEKEKKQAGKGKAAGKRSAAAAGIGSQEPGSEVRRSGCSGMAAVAAAGGHVGMQAWAHLDCDVLQHA
jgi:hypothetical protein